MIFLMLKSFSFL